MSQTATFIESTCALFKAILPSVISSLENDVASQFKTHMKETGGTDLVKKAFPSIPMRTNAFTNTSQWADKFALFLTCEKYQVAIGQMQSLLAEDIPDADQETRRILQEKVLAGSFMFLVRAFVDFQTQQDPEDDIDYCIIGELYHRLREESPEQALLFQEWTNQYGAEIMHLCLQRVRDTIKRALSQTVAHQEPSVSQIAPSTHL